MIPKPLNDIEPDDIRRLIEDQVKESRTLDYKQALPHPKEKKVDFLKDVSALANTEGGDILYGVQEKRKDGQTTGEPEAVVGLESFSFDNDSRRLMETIRSGLRPRLTGVHPHQVICPDGPVLVLRVERSFAGPHMVLHDDERFYGRGAMENYRLDPDELRRLFLRNTELPERIRRFRTERVLAINRAETPVLFPGGPMLVLHVVPVSGFDSTAVLDVRRASSERGGFMPIGCSSCSGRFNIDGYVSYGDMHTSGAARSYTQLYRNGVLEAVCVFPPSGQPSPPTRYYAAHLGQWVLEYLPQYLVRLDASDIGPPYVMMMSLLNVRGLTLPGYWSTPVGVDRNDILIPDLLLNEMPPSFADALRPAFDAMWQAAGVSGWPDHEQEKAKKWEAGRPAP